MPDVVTIGDATLYHGDALEILPTLPKVDAVVTDPPYGMNWEPGVSKRLSGVPGKRGEMRADFAPIYGDDAPFDPSPWLRVSKHCVLWGANHYADKLPLGVTLVWLKRNPGGYGTFFSDAEVGWQSSATARGVFCYCHPWYGTEFVNRGVGKLHPNEKPLGLMQWCLSRVDADAILDPYMGSGTTGVACIALGRRFVGVEIDRRYFDIACERIDNAYRQQRMFA